MPCGSLRTADSGMRLSCCAADNLGRAEMCGSGERLAVSTDSRASPVDGELWAAELLEILLEIPH